METYTDAALVVELFKVVTQGFAGGIVISATVWMIAYTLRKCVDMIKRT